MTSLEFIMDMVDEEDAPRVDKNRGGSVPPGSSRSHDPSRAGTSSHEKLKDQDDRLASASTRRRGPLSRSSKPTVTASSSSPSLSTTATPLAPPPASSSSTRPASVSGRSATASSEPMDPSGYGSHAQASSSGRGLSPSSMPSRPMGNAMGDGNIPLKLTPITGRVSRAKKGMPVHTCTECSKTFTRAEHLRRVFPRDRSDPASALLTVRSRRHQLSHATPGYSCTYPGCDKAFYRADLLQRHAHRHDQDDKRGTSAGGSRPTSAPLDDGNSPGLSYLPHDPSSMSGGSGSRSGMPGSSDISSSAGYPGSLPSYQPMGNQRGGSGQAPMSPQHGRSDNSYQASPGASSHSRYVLISDQTSGVGGSPVTGTGYGLGFEPRTSSPAYPFMETGVLTANLPALTIPDNSFPPGLLPTGHDGSPWPSSASESPYSTPSEVGYNQRRNFTRGRESPTSDWPGPGLYSSGGSHSLNSPGGGLEAIATSVAPFFPSPSFDQALGLSMLSDDHSFVEQTQPYHHYSSVRSPTPPIISLAAQPTENLVTVAAASFPDAASTGSRRKGTAVFLGSLQGATLLTANTLAPHVRNAIPKYLDVYWKRFDTLYPLIHRASAKAAANEVLRCAMAAVATQFLQGREDRIIGKELHEFAWKEANLCTQWDLQIMQAILLCEFYARFRGRSVQRHASEPFQSLYSRVVNFSAPDTLILDASTRDEQWNEWIDTESQRRLLAACFLLDAHTSVYYEQHLMRQFPISKPLIPLIRPTEDLWAARTPEEWEVRLATRPANAEPAHLSDAPLTAEQIAGAPPLDRAVFLASEALRLPKRHDPSVLDPSREIDEAPVERFSSLFPGSAVANTYLALHYTPLHDLLAVSGDTWLFSKKVAFDEVYQQHKKQLQVWCGSSHAATAAGFAAKALLTFLDPGAAHGHRNTLDGADSPSHLDGRNDNYNNGQYRDRNWNMSDISDYWAMYVCTLICWALSQRATSTRGCGSCFDPVGASSHYHNPRGEQEAMQWLKTVSSLGTEKLLQLRGRREAISVVGMVRRRLESEAVGRKSRLLVDAAGTLAKLEERAGDKWI
ncbi:hypothetical protein GGS23DRAFT_599601 [Durotheca rogersii]|uniref:uncharacterized protein n=1 Tax=Durotheca rogersii TaxID=419775 RepID=UPI00221FE58F|nr:uncharacterized protein GGS23DRAFT_599601 [Durotheca rogersii]KAI5860225.1 hypothetical protein GGS23DRAFT_599601 [Durotheca rogersii]